MSTPPPHDADRPTHVTLEVRLETEKAEALAYALARLDKLVDARVMSTSGVGGQPGFERDTVLAAVRATAARLTEALP